MKLKVDMWMISVKSLHKIATASFETQPGKTTHFTFVARPSRTEKQPTASRIRRRMEESGFPVSLADPASGVMLLVEQPVDSRALEALKRSLPTVRLSRPT